MEPNSQLHKGGLWLVTRGIKEELYSREIRPTPPRPGDRSWTVAPLGPRAALISPSLSTPALGLGGPQSDHLGKWGGARRLPPGLSWVRLAGDRGRGRAPHCPRKASLSHLTLPQRLPWLLLGPLPALLHLFTPHLFTYFPAQTSTSVRRTASSVGPARCASTPAAATSV